MKRVVKKRLRKALGSSDTPFIRCKRCPLPRWREEARRSACATLKRDEKGNWYISPDPIVTWDERKFRRRRRPSYAVR